MAETLEPILDIDEIQGNVIPGFSKDHLILIGLCIGDVDKAKKWLSDITSRISTCNEVLSFNKSWVLIKKRTNKEPFNISATWTNIAFSCNGIKQLLGEKFSEVDELLDVSFKRGLALNSSTLGDPLERNHEGHPQNWKVGAEGVSLGQMRCTPDIFLIIASDDPDRLVEENKEINNDAAFHKLVSCYEEEGHDLSFYGSEELRGHEHFGFKDGIAQPGIRGKLSEKDGDFLTPRIDNNNSSNDDSVEYGIHGKPLIAMGEFILGYPVQSPNHPRMVLPPQVTHPLLKNCSYLVFRRLKQDVSAFNNFIETESKRLSLVTDGMSKVKLKALLVGRWPSGAPLAISPENDDLELASDSTRNNNFGYADDHNGFKTPIISHIRKVNPRDLSTDIGNSNLTLKKKILRRGIPFGRPLDNQLGNSDRGLMFLSYQDSIQHKFEFLTRNWMGKSDKPTNAPSTSSNAKASGYDLLVGSINLRTNPENKNFFGYLYFKKDDKYIQHRLSTNGFSLHHWIVPTGGGYFLTPSIRMLLEMTK